MLNTEGQIGKSSVFEKNRLLDEVLIETIACTPSYGYEIISLTKKLASIKVTDTEIGKLRTLANKARDFRTPIIGDNSHRNAEDVSFLNPQYGAELYSKDYLENRIKIIIESDDGLDFIHSKQDDYELPHTDNYEFLLYTAEECELLKYVFKLLA